MNATQTKDTLRHPRLDETAESDRTREAREPRKPAAEAEAPAQGTAESPKPAEPARTAAAAPQARTANARLRDADGMAVASFVLGLVGLLAFNLVLGPCSLVLGGLALLRGTDRRFRAGLGLALGAADLIVLAAVSSADQSFSWSLTG